MYIYVSVRCGYMMVKSFAIQIGCSSTRLTFVKFLFALCGCVVSFVWASMWAAL